MAVQQNRFAPPVIPRTRSQARERTVSAFAPFGGWNRTDDIWTMGNQEAVYCKNISVRNEGLRVRSGLIRIAETSSSSDSILHLNSFGDYYIAISNNSLFFSYNHAAPSWSSQNCVPWDISADPNTFDSDSAYHNTYGQSAIITSLSSQVPQILPLDNSSSHTTHQGILDSGESYAYSVAAIDERLVFFGSVDSKGTEWPTRVRWSVRGNIDDMTSEGAGYQDLVEMEGKAERIVDIGNRTILFSTNEVWEAAPRRDAYAFDFRPIDPTTGLINKRSVINTPEGLFWVDNFGILRRMVGPRITKLGARIKLGHEAFNVGGDANEFFLAYDPKVKELMYWHKYDGNASCFVLRTDTIRQTGDDEEDGIWTFYTLNADAQIYCHTNTHKSKDVARGDITRISNVLFGTGGDGTICFWRDDYGDDRYVVGGDTSDAIVGEWITPPLQTGTLPTEYEFLKEVRVFNGFANINREAETTLLYNPRPDAWTPGQAATAVPWGNYDVTVDTLTSGITNPIEFPVGGAPATLGTQLYFKMSDATYAGAATKNITQGWVATLQSQTGGRRADG